ncbi:MAG: L-ectoine synthase, partial [Gammaproteobacteria bacterium]|nr:L-ectoine synthase [Gammaproteobacteria bacterium]
MYVLNNYDLHRLCAMEDLRLICVFNPPLKGDEKHDMSKPGTSY